MSNPIRSRMVLLIVFVGSIISSTLAGPPRPATPDEIKEMIAAAKESEDYDGADVAYVLDEADVYVAKGGLATTEACRVVKVLTDKGVRRNSVLRWEFDPDTYRTTVKEVRVHRKDGPTEDVDTALLVTQPAPQHWIYWGNMQHVLAVPRLNVGDALEIRTSKIGFNIAYLSSSSRGDGTIAGDDGPIHSAGRSAGNNVPASGIVRGYAASDSATGEDALVPPMPGHWYEVTLFQDEYPILYKRYSVHMPKDMPVQYEVYNGQLKSSMWFDGDYHVYTWSAQDVPAVKREPHMVALDDCVPKLVMATLESWEEKSRWFHQVNEPQFAADDAIRAKVAELTEGLSEEQKIAAVTHWVADNVRYYGTKQGGACEGYTLHDSANTFRDRGGVCKDKAGMLITMLRVLGHEAYPALTMAGSRVEEIPADQFNHTVTVMRNMDGGLRILDPTWVPLTRDLWSSFEDLQGLVYGVPEGHGLTLSPHFEPEYNMRFVRATGEILDNGTLRTDVEMELFGAAGNRFRRAVDSFPPAEKMTRFEEALNVAPNARIVKLEHVDPYDYSQEAYVNMTIAADSYAAAGDGLHLFHMPLMSHPLNKFFRATFMDAAEPEQRTYAMRFWATRLLRYEETIKLPDGWKVAHLPENKSIESEAASLTFQAAPQESGLTYRFELALKKGVVPAEDYSGLKKALEAMNDLAGEWIVCTAGGADPEGIKIATETEPTGQSGSR